MRRVVIVYGLISGAIVLFFLWTMMHLFDRGTLNFDNAEYFGYGSMLVALSMIFVGIKSYRDNRNEGSVSFWKGMQIGLLITLIASVMYAAGWETYLQVNPGMRDGFIERYTEHQVGKLKEKGAAQEEIDGMVNQMKAMGELYKNPIARFGMTLMEIVPVGLVVTLLSAGLLRKRTLLPS